MNGNRYFKWLSGIENFKAIEAAPQIMNHRILVSLRCKKVENGREAVALCNNDVAGDFAVLHQQMDGCAGGRAAADIDILRAPRLVES